MGSRGRSVARLFELPDWSNRDPGPGVLGQRLKIIEVARDDGRADSSSGHGDVSVNHVSGAGLGEQCPNLMRLARPEAHHIAASQEPSQLSLSRRTAGLSDDRGGRDGNDTSLESGSVISPHVAVVAIGSDQNAGVVDRRHANRLRFGASSADTR